MVKRYTALSTVRLTSGRGDTVVVKSHVPETIILAADHDSLASRHARAALQARCDLRETERDNFLRRAEKAEAREAQAKSDIGELVISEAAWKKKSDEANKGWLAQASRDAAEIVRLEAHEAALRDALEPFAALPFDATEKGRHPEQAIYAINHVQITGNDILAARAALAVKEETP